MIFTETQLKGAFVIDLQPISDERGFFARSWCRADFERHGLDTDLAQCNVSFNKHRHTLRGMHFQVDPHGETKIVRCTQGAIFDALVDMRPDSPTRYQWTGAELSAQNHRMLYIPKGFAHGFLTLTDDSEVSYMVSTGYHPASARGVRWNDPAFGIDWPAQPEVIIHRDATYPDVEP